MLHTRESLTGRRFLEPLWVLPEYQGRGLGELLIRDVLDAIDQQENPDIVCLEASLEGKRLYERLGFVSVPKNLSFMIRTSASPSHGAK